MTAQKLALGVAVKFIPYVADVRDKTAPEIKAARKVVTGKVIYINGPHSYFTIEYDWYGNTLRESFKSTDFGQVVRPIG